MRIASNQYKSVMGFALKELSDIYPDEEIKSIIYLLFEAYLNVGKTDFILNKNRGMSESELLKFNFAIKDLKKGMPVQHILGYAYFKDLKFYVNKQTLIPRPETEELVDLIINNEHGTSRIQILDIGTGTACIPISLAKEMPEHTYKALDFKQEIIDLAKRNALLHQVDIDFFVLDILKAEQADLGMFDVIISNPPYVLESEKNKMHKNVVDWEPASALYINDDQALLYYYKIGRLATACLRHEGRIYFEINEEKGQEISDLLSSLKFQKVEIHQDIHGKDRYVTGRYLIKK